MARIRNGILGGFSNKVGEVIGQNYAGVSTMRAMPKYVTNPKTPAQEAHRAKVALLGEFLRPLKLVLNLSSWGGNAVYNCFNKAFKANLSNIYYDDGKAKFSDYQSIDLGEYYGEPFLSMQVEFSVKDNPDICQVDLTWDSTLFSTFCTDLDRPIFFLLREVEANVFTIQYADLLECQRSWGSYSFEFNLPLAVYKDAQFSYCFAFTTYDIKATQANNQRDLVKPQLRDINWDYYWYKLQQRYSRARASGLCPAYNHPKPSETIKIPSHN